MGPSAPAASTSSIRSATDRDRPESGSASLFLTNVVKDSPSLDSLSEPTATRVWPDVTSGGLIRPLVFEPHDLLIYRGRAGPFSMVRSWRAQSPRGASTGKDPGSFPIQDCFEVAAFGYRRPDGRDAGSERKPGSRPSHDSRASLECALLLLRSREANDGIRGGREMANILDLRRADRQEAALSVPKGPGPERRRTSRLRVSRPISTVIRHHIRAALIDISAAGALIEHCHGLKLGEIHEITIESGRSALRVRGQVARSMASHIRRAGTQSFLIYRTAFAFLSPPPHALHTLMQYLQGRLEGPCLSSTR